MPVLRATRNYLIAGGLALGVVPGANAAEIPGVDDPAVQACIDKTAASRSVTQHITLRSFDDSGLIEESIADIYLQRSAENKSRAVIRLSGPPSRKGLAVLMVESDKLDPTMYLYVPDLRRTRKVTGKQLAASMMGTDFSYEEFSHFQRSAAESNTQRIDDRTVDGMATYVLETTPAGADSPYRRILTYIDQQRCVPLKTEFLSADDSVTKELVATPDSIRAVGEVHVPHQVVMYDRVKNTRTELSIEDLVLDAKINDTIFSPKRLGMAPRVRANLLIARFLDAVVDHPVVVVVVALAITALAFNETIDLEHGRVNVAVDSSIENLLPAEGKALQVYTMVRDKFIGDDVLIVVWITDDLFTPKRLAALKDMTREIGAVDGVTAVDSLASATYVRAEEDFTEVGPFLETLPADMAAAQSLKADALANPLYRGTLVSADGRGAVLAVHFDPSLNTDALGGRVDRIAAIAESAAIDGRRFVSGPIVARLETGRTLFSDIRLVFPLAVLATLLVSLIGLRSLAGMTLPLTVNGISLLVTMAIFIRTGHALNFVTVIMPPVIFVVGFAYAVHVVSDFERARQQGQEKLAAIKHAVRDVFMPLTLTAFTTAVGFISLVASNIDTIKVFGIFCALGTLFAWLGAVILVPAGLALLPAGRVSAAGGGSLLAFAPHLSRFDLENRKAIFAIGFIVAALSVIFANRITVGTDYLRNFDEDSDIRRNFSEVAKFFSGPVPLQILIESDVPNVFKNPDDLRELDKLQQWVVAQPEIGGAISFVDYMRMLHRTFVPDVGTADAIPGTFNLSDQLLSLGAGDDVERFADARYRKTLMHVRSNAVGSHELGALVERIEARLALLPEHLRGKVTGSSVLLAQTMDEITRGQIVSLSGALIIIYLILSILFGSLRVGAVALIPNLLPIAAFFGILGLTGITLNLATSLVATVALGIAVDDSIHYFSRFNTESRRLANEELGVERALSSIIRPVTYTTAALCAGFLALLVSDLRSQVEFGILAAATLFIAWVVDLTLSPALSAGLRFVTLWEVLSVDLGSDPHKKIPLFQGLTQRQARIAALFGRIEPYAPGDRIVAFGEEGHEICILIEGVVVVQVSRPEGKRVLRALHPGDVFGEIALFTGKRTADIDAMTDVRVLWMNIESLERIQSRYPRIAAQLYWNLTGTVAERLADITKRV